MVRVSLLYATIILGMAFILMPDWDGVAIMDPDPFIFYDFGYSADFRRLGICYQTYIYMICQLLITIIFSRVIYEDTINYKNIVYSFYLLQVGNLIDFLLCYNSIWFRFYGVPISYNIFTCVAFGCAILYFRNHE